MPVTLHRRLDASRAFITSRKGGYGIIDGILFSVVRALQHHPTLNATFDGDLLSEFENLNIAIAVDTPRGLVAPVLRDLQGMTVVEMVELRKRATRMVLAWSHSVEDLVGGTFTLTNLGAFGVDYFSPIINPPQVAILGLGRISRESVSWYPDSEPVPRWLLGASLTFDHRVLDGADGARFLETLQKEMNDLRD